MIMSDLITEVITETGGDTSDTTLQSAKLIVAKGALRRFPLFSRDRLLIDTSYATMSASNYLTVPTGFLREIAIYYLESGVKKYIEKLTESDFGAVANSTSSGNPLYYRIVGNVIEFDKTTTLLIYVEHYKTIDEVTASSTFPGDNSMIEILKDGIKATYYSDYVEDTAKGNAKFALFKAGLDELESKFMMLEQGNYINEA